MARYIGFQITIHNVLNEVVMIDINNLDKLYDSLDNGEFCCKKMHYEILLFDHHVLDVYEMPISTIWYERASRSYNIFQYTERGYWSGGTSIQYCPWCGKKLPKELDPWNTIYNEYGEDYVKYPGDPGYKELPPEVKKEFETDEWWKKRNIGPDDPGF